MGRTSNVHPGKSLANKAFICGWRGEGGARKPNKGDQKRVDHAPPDTKAHVAFAAAAAAVPPGSGPGGARGKARDVLCEVVTKSNEIAAKLKRTTGRRSADHERSISAGLKAATLRRLCTILDARPLINSMQEAIDIPEWDQHDKKECTNTSRWSSGELGMNQSCKTCNNGSIWSSSKPCCA